MKVFLWWINVSGLRAYEEKETNLDNVELDEAPTKEFKTDDLLKVINMVETVSECIMEVDPNVERSIKVCQIINNAIRCYKDMYEEKKRKKKSVQTSLLQFFKK